MSGGIRWARDGGVARRGDEGRGAARQWRDGGATYASVDLKDIVLGAISACKNEVVLHQHTHALFHLGEQGTLKGAGQAGCASEIEHGQTTLPAPFCQRPSVEGAGSENQGGKPSPTDRSRSTA